MGRQLGCRPGTRLWVLVEGDEVILRRTRTAAELAGILKPHAKPGTTWEQGRAAAERAAAEEAMEGMD